MPLNTPNHVAGRRQNRRNSGTALVAMLVALIIAGLVVMAIVSGQGRDQSAAVDRLSGVLAFYAAEGIANMSIREFMVNADEDGNSTIGSIRSAGAPASIGSPAATGYSSIATSVSGSVTTGVISVVGNHGGAARSVQVAARRTAAGTGVPGFFTQVWESSTEIAGPQDNAWTSAPRWIGITPQAYYDNTSNRARWPGHQGNRWFQSWKGRMTFPAGTHGFNVWSDDGFAMFINSVDVGNFYSNRGAGDSTFTATTAAATTDVELRYNENDGEHAFAAEWRLNNSGPWAYITSSNFTCFPPFSVAPIALSSTLTVSSSTINAFNSSNGIYGGANILTNQTVASSNRSTAGSININSSSTVSGNVQVAPGASTTTAVSVSSSTLTGTRTNLPYLIATPEYTVQESRPASGGAYSRTAGQSVSFNSTRTHDSLTLSNAATLTINGDITVYVTGNVVISSSGSIVVPSGSRLTLIVGGTITINNAGFINSSSGIPTRCRIFVAASNTARAISVDSGSTLCAEVWNTWGSLTVSGGSTFIGTYRGNTASITGSSFFRADIANTGVLSGSGSGTSAVTAWTQIAPP